MYIVLPPEQETGKKQTMKKPPQYPVSVRRVPEAHQAEQQERIYVDVVALQTPPVVEQIIAEYERRRHIPVHPEGGNVLSADGKVEIDWHFKTRRLGQKLHPMRESGGREIEAEGTGKEGDNEIVQKPGGRKTGSEVVLTQRQDDTG